MERPEPEPCRESDIGKFEIISRDGAARIGKFYTKHGVVNTPTLLPVINPNIRTIEPRDMWDNYGVEFLITNSYIIRNSEKLNINAKENGVHSLLNFPGAIMTDSGTFQSYVYGDIEVEPAEIIEFQKEIGVDVATMLDVFGKPNLNFEESKEIVEETLYTLDMYSDDVRKITLKLQKEGLEMLEAGDVVRLNFPNHNIPLADYIVFEIENVLAGTLVITVGTFSKSIAERLTEISSQSSQSSTTQFKKDGIEISAGKFLFDAIKLKEIGVSYEITGPSNALSYNSNMGFDDLVGFTEEVGFEHSTVTKKTYGDKFYEQEDY